VASFYLRKQHRKWWARFQVPKDVQDSIGKTEVWINLYTEDRKQAEARALRQASAFRARVLEARGMAGTIEEDALMWRRIIREEQEQPDNPDVTVDAAIRVASDRFVQGGYKAVTRAAHLHHEGSEGDALLALGGEKAERFVDIAIKGVAPLRPYVDAWASVREGEVETKTAAMDKAAVYRFVEAFPFVDKVTKAAVYDWAQRRKVQANVSPTTVQREMSGIRSFWAYVRQRGEIAADAPDPFAGLRFKSRAKDTARARREGFTAAEVAALFAEARRQGDDDLTDLIALAAYTGARREELCSLRIEDVRGEWLKIADAKTEAGARDVPVHPRIKSVITKRIGKRSTGFVFEGLDSDKYGKRGDAVGKRFTRLKTGLGHGATKTFHSIRHTVVHLLEGAGVPENLTADIVGHKKTTMSYGLYSGRGATRGLLGETIAKLSYPRPLK
jgi:integrase